MLFEKREGSPGAGSELQVDDSSRQLEKFPAAEVLTVRARSRETAS
jgi:hypothetical protein